MNRSLIKRAQYCDSLAPNKEYLAGINVISDDVIANRRTTWDDYSITT